MLNQTCDAHIFSFFDVYTLLYLFIIYFWLCWVFVAAHGLSLVAVHRLLSAEAFLMEHRL